MDQQDSSTGAIVELLPRRVTEIRYHLVQHFGTRHTWSLAGPSWAPPVDCYETSDSFVIEVNLGGVAPEEVRVAFEGEVVRISGERPEYGRGGVRCYHVIEIERGPFERLVDLPVPVDPRTAEAVFRHGLLVIRVAKRISALHGCSPAENMEGLE